MSFEFVVPSKHAASSPQSKLRRSGTNLDHGVCDGGSKNMRGGGLRDLSVQRQLVQHVRQRLDMHEPVLNGNVQQSVESEAIALAPCIAHQLVVEGIADLANVLANTIER